MTQENMPQSENKVQADQNEDEEISLLDLLSIQKLDSRDSHDVEIS